MLKKISKKNFEKLKIRIDLYITLTSVYLIYKVYVSKNRI